MSYCRFSSNDWQCDVYCYESTMGGFCTHVAANRVVFKEPLPDPVPIEDFEKWWAREQKIMDILKVSEHVDIDLPHAGETFYDSSEEAMFDRLRKLKALGYNVPDWVFTQEG